ncbi:hypothetical protein UlMin_039457 [Ulmus minor]
MEIGFAKFLSDTHTFAAETESHSTKSRTNFQWGGTIFALLLLILNRVGRRSSIQTTLIVFYLFISFPNVLFKILRGTFGRWLSFLAIAANLFFPEHCPVARFILFVITPDWVTKGLREGLAGSIVCLVIGVLLFITEVRGVRRTGVPNGFHCFCDFVCIGLILLFTIMLW